MRYFDLIGQSLILLGFAFVIPLGWVDTDILFSVMFAQLCIGCWQIISSLISIVSSAPYARYKQLHFIAAILYLIFLMIPPPLGGFLPDYLLVAVFTVPAWAMVAWYYYITWRWVFQKRSTGKFLPHVFL